MVSWLPADAVSKSILDVAFAREQPPFALNLVHPRPVAWNDVITAVANALIKQKKLENKPLRVVPFHGWFSLLERRANSVIKC